MTATAVIRRILDTPELGKRIAQALNHLEVRWPHATNEFREGSTAMPPVARFGRATRTAKRFDEVNDLAKSWLAMQPRTDDTILAYVLIIDGLLAPFAGTNSVSLLAGDYAIGDDTIHLWIAHRGFFQTFFHDARVRQRFEASPRLDDLLGCIRHVRSISARRTMIVRDLPLDVVRLFDALFDDAGGEPLRIGLFSLFGEFSPSIAYSRTRDTPLGPKYLFRAGAVTPEEAYCDRIRAAVRLAANSTTGVEILVLPELMMTASGINALREELLSTAGGRPFLVIAGSAHETHPASAQIGNRSCVFDYRGALLWEQWKQIPYGDHEDEGQLRDVVEGLPESASGTLRIGEDIEAFGGFVLGRTPIGTFATMICSDAVHAGEDMPLTVWNDAPVDWVAIPAYTHATSRFLEAAHTLNGTSKIVLFVNAFDAVRRLPPKAAGDPERWKTSPRRFSPSEDRPEVSAFVSTPWTQVVAMRFGDDVEQQAEGVCRVVAVAGEWEGLVIDLASFLHRDSNVIDV